MPFYFDQGGTNRYTLQDFEPSFGTKMGAAVDEAWAESYGPVVADWARKQLSSGPKMSAMDADAYIKQSGLRLDLKPKDNEYSQDQLDIILERQRELTIAKDIRERTPWDWGSPVRGLAMFGAGIVDPINLATAFVPWTRAMSIARPLEAARLSTSALTRFGGRAGLGAIDAGISTAALEPLYAYMRRDLGDDYDAYDSMVNIAFGAAFGGGVLGLGGAGVDAFRKATGRIAPSERFRGLSNQDIQLVTNLEREIANGMPMSDVQKVLATYSPEMRRAAGFGETVLQPGKPRTMSHRVIDQDGQLMSRGDAGFVSGAIEGDRLVINVANVAERYDALGDNVTLFQRLIDSAIDRGLRVDSDAVVDASTVRVYEALANEGFVVSRSDGVTVLQPSDALPNGGLMSADGVSPVFRISRGAGYTKPLDTAKDVVERIDPETREATFRAGIAQMMDGRNISVDSIINTDPASGGAATAEDIAASAKLNQQAESIRTADFDASSKIDEENKSSPRWDGISDAEQALADADTQLNDTIKTGSDAYKFSRSIEDAKNVDQIGFYSFLQNVVDNIQQKKGSGEQFLAQISKTAGVKPDEIKWTGLDEFLLDRKSVTKEEIQEFLSRNKVDVEEVTLSGMEEPDYTTLRIYWNDGDIYDDYDYIASRADDFLYEENDYFPGERNRLEQEYIANRELTEEDLQNDVIAERLKNDIDDEMYRIAKQYAEDEYYQNPYYTWSNEEGYSVFGNDDIGYTVRNPQGRDITPNRGAYDKDTVEETILQHAIENEVIAPEGNTKFSEWTLPGGENYREVLMTLPTKFQRDTYESGHFDEPNILAHFRIKDRVDADGKRMLFVEEIQSDWHQAGRKKGYLTQEAKLRLKDIDTQFADLLSQERTLNEQRSVAIAEKDQEKIAVIDSQLGDIQRTQTSLIQESKSLGRVPDAPFKTTWHELAVKRIIRMAAEEGYERIGFTTGVIQAERYNLSRQVRSIDWQASSREGSVKLITIQPYSGNTIELPITKEGTVSANAGTQFDGKRLDEIIGKDIAKQIIEQNDGSLSGEGLAIGGEGMRGFYDNILPKFLNKYGKKWDAEVGKTDIPTDTGRMEPVWKIDITQKMKDAVLTEGQPMFARGQQVVSAENIYRKVEESFGKATQILLDSGSIKIVNSVKDIPSTAKIPDDVKAATLPDGTVYIVANRVSPNEVKNLVLHEVGVHVGMEKMLGTETFSAVLTQLDDAIIRGESWAMAARDAVPADTLPQHIREEQLAYLVQNSPDLPIVKQIIAAIRAWAYRTFEIARERMTLTEDDFRALAISALKYTARTELTPPVLREGRLVSVFARSIDQIATPEFRRWFGNSKIVDADGKPMVMYHGTYKDFSAFDLGMRKAIFVTPEPEFANYWSGGRVVMEDGFNPRVMPLYVKAENPFDYENPQHIDAVISRLNPVSRRGIPIDMQNVRDNLELGKWGYIEDQDVQQAIKNAGFDSFYIKERGIKNLGIYDPTQLKSAIGNIGTFDPANPDVRYSRGTTQDTSTESDALKSADAALRRAKQYSGVLRAAADKLDNDADAVNAMRSQLPDITAEEIDQLLNGLRKQVTNMRNMTRATKEALLAGDRVNDMQSEAMQAADMLANNLAMAAVIARRGEALDINARLKASTFLQQFRDKGLDFEGFAALLVGSERVRVGSRVSVDAEYKGFRGEWLGGMIADLEKANLKREFISGSFDRDIYDALWRMGQDSPDMTGLSPQVVKMAEIVNKYQTNARNRRNRFGAWIRDLQGYITRQSHDMYKIRAVTDDEWIAFVKDRLDLPKMMRLGLISEDDPIGSLRALYDQFSSGLHMKGVAGEEDVVAFKLGANLAKRESVSRALYFKDGIAAYEYNDKFGSGRLAESVILGLDHAARSAALLKTLGRNPMVTLTRLMDEYQDSITDPKRRSQFYQDRGKILNLLAQVDGSVNIPGNVTAAKVGSFMRSWQSMAKLGGALISSFSDLAGYAAELRYAQGKNMLSGVADGIGALVKGRPKGERAEILASLGVFHESVAGSVTARFDNPDLVSGKMAAAMQQFFRLNGLTWWTETLRDGAALSHSHYMALQAARPFDQIDTEMQRLLTVYKVDAAKWNLMRMATMQMADGRAYMTPEALRTIPRKAMEDYIASTGRTVSDVSVQNLMDDLSQTLRLMAVDRAHHAVIEPSARTRAWMLRGTKPGTVAGELLRYIGQFKSFSIAMVHTVLGREVYGRGYDTVGEYLKKGRGDMLGLANMIGLYGLLGYGSMSIKDLIKGRKPRDPIDPKTVMAALAQGGGMGLYGDFLFGEYSRFGRSFTSSLAGPVLGQLDTLTDLWTRLRKGDDMAAASFKALLENTPFANLFWIRPLLDYAVIWNIQESLNPGYLRRMESRIERENNQQFLLRPSEVVR